MPIYAYECISCKLEFEEIRKESRGSGKSKCPKCGYLSFKVPSVFAANIFQPKQFADGTTTPPHVSTPSQEKAWMRSQGITYDAPSSDVKYKRKKEQKQKSETAMELAFKKAYKKTEQGFKIHTPKGQKIPSKLGFEV